MQWVSWLRHTRTAAPTINDLIQEERRREMVQGRAKALDQQWAKVIKKNICNKPEHGFNFLCSVNWNYKKFKKMNN